MSAFMAGAATTFCAPIRQSTEKRNAPGTSDRCVLSRERQQPRLAMNSEACDAIALPVACIHEFAARIDPALSRIIAHGRSFADPFQPAISSDGKRRNGIVQPVCRVEKLTARRYQNL